MEPSKDEIIDSLHKIMCTATSTAGDSRVTNNDYFKRRVLGFRAELEFENLISTYQSIAFIEGGQFISKNLSGSKEDENVFSYVTVSFDDPLNYVNIYSLISRWNEVAEMYFIRILPEWSEEELKVKEIQGGPFVETGILRPQSEFYCFNRVNLSFEPCSIQDYDCLLGRFGKSDRSPPVFALRKRDQFDYFAAYTLEQLKKIYATRYFLDVVLRKAPGRKIIDIDGYLATNTKTIMVEIKEKSPIYDDRNPTNKQQWRFGWDTRRILWYLYIQHKLGFKILYNVRTIKDRESREFMQWDSVYLDKFIKAVDWSSSRSGGGGEDTILAPYLFFDRIEQHLTELIE